MAELVRVKFTVLCLLTGLAEAAGIVQRSELRTRGTKVVLLLCTQVSVKLDRVLAFTCYMINIFCGSVNITGLRRADELGLGDGRFTAKLGFIVV